MISSIFRFCFVISVLLICYFHRKNEPLMASCPLISLLLFFFLHRFQIIIKCFAAMVFSFMFLFFCEVIQSSGSRKGDYLSAEEIPTRLFFLDSHKLEIKWVTKNSLCIVLENVT